MKKKRNSDMVEQQLIVKNIDSAIESLRQYAMNDQKIAHSKHQNKYFRIALDALDLYRTGEGSRLRAMEILLDD